MPFLANWTGPSYRHARARGFPLGAALIVAFPETPAGPVHLSLKPGSLTAALGRHRVDTWDAAGRWLGGIRDGRYYRRGLDHRMVGGLVGTRPARRVLREAADQVLARVQRETAALLDDLRTRAPASGTLPALREAAEHFLAFAATQGPAEHAADAARFEALYGGPVPAVPGELYRVIYLQSTRGCAWNRCSYCTLYANVPTSLRKGLAWAQHLDDVARYFGPALEMRRTAFLGDADAFLPPQAVLLDQLRAIPARFQVAAVDAFGAPDSVLRRQVGDLVELRSSGLRRVYLGLESGCIGLRETLSRREPLQDVRDAVQRLAEAGLSVGLTVLVGVGGRAWADRHLHDTIEVLRGMPLGIHDVVSLSPYRPFGGEEGAGERGGPAALPLDEAEGELDKFKRALDAVWPSGGPRAAPYDLDAFVC